MPPPPTHTERSPCSEASHHSPTRGHCLFTVFTAPRVEEQTAREDSATEVKKLSDRPPHPPAAAAAAADGLVEQRVDVLCANN